MLYDGQERRIYAYPYREFAADLSARSQVALAEEYAAALRSGQMVVFVRDNVKRRLVSCSVPDDQAAGAAAGRARTAPARRTKPARKPVTTKKQSDKPADPVWSSVKDRLVIVSNGLRSFFAQNACEVAQHVRIDDETGTVAARALFNQETVPSEALFYSIINAFKERTPNGKDRPAGKALDAFKTEVEEAGVFQFGEDASTGLGYGTVRLAPPAAPS